MGNTAKAYKRPEKTYGNTRVRASRHTLKTSGANKNMKVLTKSPPEWYQELKTSLLRRYTDEPIKTIMFASTKSGVGASTTSINFATALAKDSEVKVLMVEVNIRTPSLHEKYRIDKTLGLAALLSDGDTMAPPIKKVGSDNLYVLQCDWKQSNPLGLFESDRFRKFLKIARKKFDYVILDAPPILSFPESLVLCAQVDGVVLVVEAGKTRRQVAARVKKEVEEAGGRLLGQILNKREYYIPEWIYRWL